MNAKYKAIADYILRELAYKLAHADEASEIRAALFHNSNAWDSTAEERLRDFLANDMGVSSFDTPCLKRAYRRFIDDLEHEVEVYHCNSAMAELAGVSAPQWHESAAVRVGDIYVSELEIHAEPLLMERGWTMQDVRNAQRAAYEMGDWGHPITDCVVQSTDAPYVYYPLCHGPTWVAGIPCKVVRAVWLESVEGCV